MCKSPFPVLGSLPHARAPPFKPKERPPFCLLSHCRMRMKGGCVLRHAWWMGWRDGPCTYRGSDTCFQQATEECGRVHSWMGFFEDFLECLREKYPFLSLLLVKGRKGRSSCPKDWMGETFSPVEGETGAGGEVRHVLWAGQVPALPEGCGVLHSFSSPGGEQ